MSTEKLTSLIREDGYINASQLCKENEKCYSNWKQIKKTKIFLKELSVILNLSENQLIEINCSSNKDLRSTWVHQYIGTNIAQWISSSFSVKVSIWIDEWKNYKNKNLLLYKQEIKNLIPDQNIQTEKEIQLRLQVELKGEIEVKTEDGYIDLLTDTEIIEIKNGDNWKHGFGQLEVYSTYYKYHTKRLHLFDIESDLRINKFCKNYNIKVTYEN
jgi:hypothetical protein